MNAQPGREKVSRIFKGISAAPGLARGPVINYRQHSLEFEHRDGCDQYNERSQLHEAIQRSKLELKHLRDQLAVSHPAEAAVFDAHILMLEDASLLSRVDESLATGLNAEAAWIDDIMFFADQLEVIPDATLQARAADLKDNGSRVFSHLLGTETETALLIRQPSAERTNSRGAHLTDACHPAILRLIRTVISVGHAAGIWVGVCGELAGDQDAIPVLLGMGLDEFSMAPRSIDHPPMVVPGGAATHLPGGRVRIG